MSWGSAEYAGEGAFDGDFTTPAGHPGVTFVAATGDAGAPGLYPAYSPNVLAVGGTDLTLQADGSYGGESGWTDGGGGTSITEAQPAYQAGVQATGRRTIPDVAFDADPQTGASVYDSYDDTNGDGPWMKTGGTSLAAPIWAALIAIADQGRVAAGGTTLDGAVAGPAGPLRPAGRRFPRRHHRRQRRLRGRAGLRPVHRPGQPVGRAGRPGAGLLRPGALAGDRSGPPSVVTAGQPFGMTVEVENSDGSLDANFVGSVTIRLGDDPGGDALGGTLTEPAIGGYATFTGLTLTRAARRLHDPRRLRRRPGRRRRPRPFAVAAAAPRSSWSSAPRRPSTARSA